MAMAAENNDKKILVVDDEDAILIILKNMLSLSGFNVQTARNGQEALSLIKDNVFNYIVTDLRMPIMNGIELLREISKMGIDSKLFVMTASNISEFSKDDQKMIIEKTKGLLTKPFVKDELIEKLVA